MRSLYNLCVRTIINYDLKTTSCPKEIREHINLLKLPNFKFRLNNLGYILPLYNDLLQNCYTKANNNDEVEFYRIGSISYSNLTTLVKFYDTKRLEINRLYIKFSKVTFINGSTNIYYCIEKRPTLDSLLLCNMNNPNCYRNALNSPYI